jgi:hypothetical protein
VDSTLLTILSADNPPAGGDASNQQHVDDVLSLLSPIYGHLAVPTETFLADFKVDPTQLQLYLRTLKVIEDRAVQQAELSFERSKFNGYIEHQFLYIQSYFQRHGVYKHVSHVLRQWFLQISPRSLAPVLSTDWKSEFVNLVGKPGFRVSHLLALPIPLQVDLDNRIIYINLVTDAFGHVVAYYVGMSCDESAEDVGSVIISGTS